MPDHDLLHDRQAQPDAPGILSRRPVKAFEQVGQVLRHGAAAVVLQRAVEGAVRLLQDNEDLPALRRMLAGVLHQVAERLGQPLPVAADHGFALQFQFPVRPERLQLLPCLFDEFPDVAFIIGKIVSVRAELLQPQQAADQRLHPFDLAQLLFAVLAAVHLTEQAEGC